MKKYAVIAAVALMGLASCSEGKFHVEGNITGAKDSVLYFEQVGISDISVVDSVRLDGDGDFAFSGERQEAPEFYRLRISDQIINVSIDSTETVTVKAQYPQMATQYEVSGSENCQKIKELALRQIDLQQRAIAISRNDALSVEASNDSILAIVRQYKDEVKRQYIFPAPDKAYAYFALFQALGDMLLFNPRTNRDDIKVFAAVATSWDTYYPQAERGQNLHNIAIEGMKNVRMQDASGAQTIDASKIRTTGIIDIELTDNHGKTRRLTDLEGKVVLLDFHVFATEESPARILLLRELYNKYHAQGLEIYQVSLDPDEHFWKQQTASLPWISVREEQGLASPTLAIYNVQAVPEYFLIDRNSNIVGRSQSFKDVEQSISQLCR
ncbi:MAG: AhpC/TSA family protein [Prevotella sp.]|nr:AhpC/TSA family protein [Prevotella sp.]MBQ9186441.1 AhpC/TSA family protein [Prevotella sp.]